MYDIDQLSRHFLELYFLFIGVHYTSTSVGLWKRTGISHIRYGNRGSATWWYRQTFNLFRAAILGVCLARIVWPIDPWLGVFPALYQAPVLLAGMAMLLVSYSIVSYVHAYMRNDWRSGIDPDKRQPLLTQGPYGLTRNPMFIGIILGQLGLFLTFPSVFTLLCLLVGAVVIVLQARREEVALSRAYGVEYQDYRLLVRRWL
jgi:protein-S-isoprenylcysteine O-methyltransferase Ste14